jgi:hypothetical protein
LSDEVALVVSLVRLFRGSSISDGIRLGSVAVLRCQTEVEHKLPRSLVVTLELLEVDNKVVLDSEDRVRGEVRVIVGVYLCCAWLVTFTGNL